MLCLSSLEVVLLIAFFTVISSASAQKSTGYGGNLRKIDFKEGVADRIENIQPEDEVFWKRALSMSTVVAFFDLSFLGDLGSLDTSSVDSSASCGESCSCGISCTSDSDCGGICMKCRGIDPVYNPTGNCGG